MDANFWHQRWATNNIAFHHHRPNPLFVRYVDTLSLAQKGRVFIPLCGKTLDIAWLLSQGYRVAGAELSEFAIQQLFDEMDITPEIVELENLKLYRAEDIDIFVGDIFDLTPNLLGAVDAIFDRAALFALPEQVRIQYTQHLITLTQTAPQLLITFVYDQDKMAGPPFSVSGDEVARHYQSHYEISLLSSAALKDGLRGVHPAVENLWLLQPRETKKD